MAKALVTPRGRLRFPAVNRPDRFSEEQALKFKADIIVPDGEKTQAFIATCEKMLEAKMAETGKKRSTNGWPISNDTDQEGTETGNIRINCRVPAHWKKSGEPREAPKVYGPDNNIFGEEVYHGADAQVAVEPYAWASPSGCGISLQPIRVRVYANGQPRGITDAELDELAWDEEGSAPAPSAGAEVEW